METRSCYGCGRVNSPTARRCMWCGLPIIDFDTEDSFEPTTAQLNYEGGIERLDEPIQVRVTVGSAGVEVTEMMPGSRRVLIPVHSLIGAEVEAAGSDEGEEAPAVMRRLSLGKHSRAKSSGKSEDRASEGCALTINYSEGSETRAATFRAPEVGGRSSVNSIAQTIALLIRWRKHRAGG